MATSTISFLTQNDKSGRFPALDEAVRSMVSTSFVQGRFRIEMPVVMAGGSASTVTVWPEGNGDTYMVSDDGAVLFEIMSGAFSESIFRRVAYDKCARYGANFDGGSMIYLRVSSGKLRGAIVAMANLMKEVVDETILRSISQNSHRIDEELWDKLDRAFSGLRVQHKVPLAGESTALHEFSAVVRTEKGVLAFDTFTAQGNSINSIYVKMADVSRSDAPPKTVAITKRLSDIGPKLHLITSVAQVFEISVEPDALQRLVFAA
jgi:hypothetical protein